MCLVNPMCPMSLLWSYAWPSFSLISLCRGIETYAYQLSSLSTKAVHCFTEPPVSLMVLLIITDEWDLRVLKPLHLEQEFMHKHSRSQSFLHQAWPQTRRNLVWSHLLDFCCRLFEDMLKVTVWSQQLYNLCLQSVTRHNTDRGLHPLTMCLTCSALTLVKNQAQSFQHD